MHSLMRLLTLEKGNSSRQGTLVFATDGKTGEEPPHRHLSDGMGHQEKIPRVVRSTLSAEAVALGAALDRLSWLRIFWEWMKNPGVDWSNPNQVLAEAPQAVVATDCKVSI